MGPGHSGDTSDPRLCEIVASVLARIGDPWNVQIVRALGGRGASTTASATSTAYRGAF